MGYEFGSLTPNAVGTLMKEAVRRAIVAIRGHRFRFETRAKEAFDGGPDFVTTADQAAQKVFVTLLQSWFPTFGIVAEEDDLRVPCTHPRHDVWFTVDALDGTRAFMRRQSHGIGTMLALVCDGTIVAACIGDVMTSEVYAARPEGEHVHRISEFGVAERLVIDPRRPLGSQWLLVGERYRPRSPFVAKLVADGGALFAGAETATGSIGLSLARLWKSEVGGAVFGPFGRGTPWDLYPVLGLSWRLGFKFFAVSDEGVEPWEPPVDRNGVSVPSEILVVHGSRSEELQAWARRRQSILAAG